MIDHDVACFNYERVPGCEGTAVTAWFCRAEGRHMRMCRPCNIAWKESARNDAGLSVRCPACGPRYLANRVSTGHVGTNVATSTSPEPLTGALADAIDKAMFQEGILVDKRAAVLARLGALGQQALLAVSGASSED